MTTPDLRCARCGTTDYLTDHYPVCPPCRERDAIARGEVCSRCGTTDYYPVCPSCLTDALRDACHYVAATDDPDHRADGPTYLPDLLALVGQPLPLADPDGGDDTAEYVPHTVREALAWALAGADASRVALRPPTVGEVAAAHPFAQRLAVRVADEQAEALRRLRAAEAEAARLGRLADEAIGEAEEAEAGASDARADARWVGALPPGEDRRLRDRLADADAQMGDPRP